MKSNSVQVVELSAALAGLVVLGELRADGFGLALTDFGLDEIAGYLADTTTGLTDAGDSTDAATVKRVLDGVRPHLMVTDPPEGVEYDPAWQNRAGLGTTQRVGKVENDNRAE